MAFVCAQCGRLCLDLISYLMHIKKEHPELHRRMSAIFDFDDMIRNLRTLRETNPEEWEKGMVLASQLVEYYFPNKRSRKRKKEIKR